jgi:hypothetical protein
MSLYSRIVYQKKKYNLRKIKIPPVNNIIFSENSSEHWAFLFVEDLNVLDLGIGRWGVNEVEETSPAFFKNNKAKKIIGIDCDKNEVNFFKEHFSKNYHDESEFRCMHIKNRNDLAFLLSENEINVIKCDIEGGEINLFKLKLQEYLTLQHVAIEYHSAVLLRQLLKVNNLQWKFNVINHSIFSQNLNMGVITLSRFNSNEVSDKGRNRKK